MADTIIFFTQTLKNWQKSARIKAKTNEDESGNLL